MTTSRLTMAQALVRFLVAQHTLIDGREVPIFAGIWAIFGHGNVAGLGEALYQARDDLPTFRAHNEQAMAHAATAYAKATFRRRFMACTTSIGPGATNMVTAAAVAHVNRLPVLLLPGDVFANRAPDPVLQQVEDFGDGTISANDCFRPVSRYFDRIARPEQIIPALIRAMQVLTDPADCGPVTLALCQDVQTEAFDYPDTFFARRLWQPRRPEPDAIELANAARTLSEAKRPLIIAGGGVLYSGANEALKEFSERHGIPVAETQAGKSALPNDAALNVGAIGVTGTAAANTLAELTDVVLAIGTRLQDFTTGSRALFRAQNVKLVGLNIQAFDAGKHDARPLVADAKAGLAALSRSLADYHAPKDWLQTASKEKDAWTSAASAALSSSPENRLPSDAQIIGSVARASGNDSVLVCAAGGLPGELHKLWRASAPGSYHLEYGFSCMGYEIAGGLGVKLARPESEIVVMVGDGSYLMLNSEIATSIMLGLRLTIVVVDNKGFGCINRLQVATGGASFNNLLADTQQAAMPQIDFRAHAESLGAIAVKATTLEDLEKNLKIARTNDRTTVVVIDADPLATSGIGGAWWDVAVPEVSTRREVIDARAAYVDAISRRRAND
jgi:3D-(3,5/4)-trihydroxycyclohexane-1,2-dione acylhydrolase (decyclizing)